MRFHTDHEIEKYTGKIINEDQVITFNQVTRIRTQVNHEESDDNSSIKNIPAPPARQPPVATSGVFMVNIPLSFHYEVNDQVRSIRNRNDNTEVQDQRVLFKLLMNILDSAHYVQVKTARESDMPETPCSTITLADCLLLEHTIKYLLIFDVS